MKAQSRISACYLIGDSTRIVSTPCVCVGVIISLDILVRTFCEPDPHVRDSLALNNVRHSANRNNLIGKVNI